MSPDTYLDRLRARLRDFTREHGVLGQYHDDRLFDELNEIERLISDEERRLSRRTARPSWLSSIVAIARPHFVGA